MRRDQSEIECCRSCLWGTERGRCHHIALGQHLLLEHRLSQGRQEVRRCKYRVFAHQQLRQLQRGPAERTWRAFRGCQTLLSDSREKKTGMVQAAEIVNMLCRRELVIWQD